MSMSSSSVSSGDGAAFVDTTSSSAGCNTFVRSSIYIQHFERSSLSVDQSCISEVPYRRSWRLAVHVLVVSTAIVVVSVQLGALC